MRNYHCQWYVPDLPNADDIHPYLTEIDSNRFYSNFGPLHEKLKRKLHQYFFSETRGFISLVNSGTSALEMSLRNLKLNRGAKVLVPAFTFAASAVAVVRAGYDPIFCDVDESDWRLSPEIAESVIEKRQVDAVLPVSSLGYPQNAMRWAEFSSKNSTPVVIDAAASLLNQSTAIGVTICFSLHATKPFGIGEGGIVWTSNSDDHKEIERDINFGFSDGEVKTVGGNYKLNEFMCAVGLAQLKRFRSVEEKRTSLYASVFDLLNQNHFELPEIEDSMLCFGAPANMAFLARSSRDASTIRTALDSLSIESRRPYCPPLHRHAGFKKWVDGCFENNFSDLTVTEDIQSRIVGIPVHNFVGPDYVEKISRCLIQ